MTSTHEKFGPFLVYEKLGAGGTASVFRARMKAPDGREIDVSLKRLHPHLASDDRVVEEFVEEAKIARLMRHRNISRFYQLGRLGDQYFIATEFIDGVDLGRLLQNAHEIGRPPSISVVLSLLVQLCDALEYAHNRVDEQTGEWLDFVHRDISPSNLIIAPDGTLKLIDMGIAKARTSSIKTETGIIKGKLGYMAPEVVAGGDADRRADIFAVGVVAWELLTARRLFGGGTDAEIVERIEAGVVPSPSTVNPACPPQIDRIVLRALSMRAINRWTTAGLMKRALQAAAATLHEPIDPVVVAEWVRGSTGLSPRARARGTAPPTPTPTPDVTTQVHRRPTPAPPERPSRFPTGTGQLPLLPPADLTPITEPRLRAASETAAVTVGEMHRRPASARRRWLAGVLGASLALNGVLLIGLIAANNDPAPPARPTMTADPNRELAAEPDAAPADSATAPARATAPAPTTAPAAPAAEPARRAEPNLEPAAAAAAASAAADLPVVDFAELTRYRGKLPRSRSSRAAYRARLCIDARGRVTEVEPLAGPERLFRRIRRTLSHWRFRPHRRGDSATAVCTVFEGRLQKWSR